MSTRGYVGKLQGCALVKSILKVHRTGIVLVIFIVARLFQSSSTHL